MNDDEIKAYVNKRIELLVGSKRCEGVLAEQFKDDGEWWMRLNEFWFSEDGQGKKRDNYRIKISEINGYGPAME